MSGDWLFSLWLGGALALAIAVSAWQAHRLGIARGVWADALLSGLAGGVLGARLGGFLLAGGGMLLHVPLSGLGSIAGALLALGWWGRKRADGWAVADALMVGVLAGTTLLWLGAFQTGVAYGQPYFGDGALVAADAYGLRMPRWPVQLVGAGGTLMVALLLLALLPRRAVPDGVLALVGGWGLLLALFGLGFWRGDSTFLLGPFRVEQLGYLVALTLVALALPQRWRQGQRG